MKKLRTQLPLLYVLSATLFFFGLNTLWRHLDATPAHWDMARHLSASQGYLELFQNGFWKSFIAQYFYYPPFYYYATLPFVLIFGWSVNSAVAANLVFMVVLAVSTFAIVKKIFDVKLAVLSAFIVLTFPMLSSQFKEYQLDAPMAAMVVSALALLYYAGSFRNRAYSSLFGLAVGLGMLTKWTYFLFVAPSAIYVLVLGLIGSDRKKAGINAVLALVIATIVAGPWYIANRQQLRSDFTQGGINSAILEGDPTGWTWPAFTWYFWSFLDHHLWLVGMIVVAVGLAVIIAKRELRQVLAITLISIIFGYLAISKLDNKDARYILPVVAQFAVIIAALISVLPKKLQSASSIIVVAGGLFIYGQTTFGLPFQEGATLRLSGKRTATVYSAGSYTIHPPKFKSWHFDDIFARAVSDGGHDKTIQFLGRDCPEFNRWDLAYYTKMYGMRWVGEDLSKVNYDYLIIRAAIADDATAAKDMVRSLGASVYHKGEWQLPDGSRAYLYRVEAGKQVSE